MSEKKTCAWVSKKGWQYPRPVWEGGDDDEQYCLFHSKNYEAKKEEFNNEIDAVLRGKPSELFLKGERDSLMEGIEEEELPLSFYDFFGFRFPIDGADFRGKAFDGDVFFDEACFAGNSSFDEAKFCGNVSFYGAKFCGIASFAGAKFGGTAVFSGVRFVSEAEFGGARFDGFARFELTDFEGSALFYVAEFGGITGFQGTNFRGEAGFFGAEFRKLANFDASIFGSYANFDGAMFSGDAGFRIAEFVDYAGFSEAEFRGNLILNSAVFKKGFFLLGNKIAGSLNLNKCSFNGNIVLYALSSRCLDIGDILFPDKFLTIENISFTDVPPEHYSCLSAALERTRIINTDLSYVSFKGAFLREVQFDRVWFNSGIDKSWKWESRLFGRPKEAIYEERVARKGNDESGLNDGKGEETRKRNDAFGAAETIYRTLKHEMEKQHAYGLARRFRAGELECKLHGNYSGTEKFLLFMYRFINGFGLRRIRAGVIWLCFIMLFTFGYSLFGGKATYERYVDKQVGYVIEKTATQLDIPNAFRHSLETSTIFLSPKHRLDEPQADAIEFLQRIICPFLLIMFGQAARNAARD